MAATKRGGARVLRLVQTPAAQPDKDTIAALESALNCAQRGELRAVAICAKDKTGREHIAFLGDYRDDPAQGVNASMRMAHRLIAMQEGDGE